MFRFVVQFVFTNLQTAVFSLLESDFVTEQDLFFVYSLFSFSIFHFATKHYFIKVTSGGINLLINILLHCTEGPKLKKHDLRWVEFRLITCSGP